MCRKAKRAGRYHLEHGEAVAGHARTLEIGSRLAQPARSSFYTVKEPCHDLPEPSHPSSANQPHPRVIGYLPQDRPPLGELLTLGLQHVLTMFPATVLVRHPDRVRCRSHVFASGFATIRRPRGSGMRIPLYYGSSFSYIAAVVAIVGAEGGGVRVAQGGIIATAMVSVIAGFLIRWAGKNALDKVLPPIVTGSVAIVIGISLAKTALDMASAQWGIAFFTLLATILFRCTCAARAWPPCFPCSLALSRGTCSLPS